MAGLEGVLRGILAGLLLFLTASAATVFVAEPSHALQFLQMAHLGAGRFAVAVGVAYLAVHLLQVFGAGKLLSRRVLRLPAALIACVCVLVAFLAQDLRPDVRLSVNVSLALFAVGTCALTAHAMLRVVRSRGTAGLAIGGAATLVALLVACGSGLLIATGVVIVPGTERDGAWLVHALSSPLALAGTLLHIARSRSARRRGISARSYPWRAPLVFLGLPIACIAGAATLWTVREGVAHLGTPTVLEGTIVATDSDLAGMLDENCALCHDSVRLDWERSSHALAAANPVFVAMIRDLYVRDQRPLARNCLHCHAPHALDPTAVPLEEVLESEGFGAGVHCVSCHRSTPGPGHGDGDFTVTPLAFDRFSFLTDDPAHRSDRTMANALVSSRLARHMERFRFESREETACLPCHVQSLRTASHGRLREVLQDHYDSWTRSPAAEAGVGCRDCHMPLFLTPDIYYARDHRFLGGSTYLAWLAGGSSAVDEVVQTLTGAMPLRPMAFGELPSHDHRAPLELRVEIIGNSPSAVLRVRTRNTGHVGHSIPNGPSDLIQFWLAIRVTDATGTVLLDLGADGPEGAPQLGHRLFDESGAPILDHRLWAVASVKDLGAIPERGWHELTLELPSTRARPPFEVSATWNYRRLDPELVLRLTGEDAAPGLPTVPMGHIRTEIGQGALPGFTEEARSRGSIF